MPHPSHIVQAIIPTFSLTNLFMTIYIINGVIWAVIVIEVEIDQRAKSYEEAADGNTGWHEIAGFA